LLVEIFESCDGVRTCERQNDYIIICLYF